MLVALQDMGILRVFGDKKRFKLKHKLTKAESRVSLLKNLNFLFLIN